MFKLLTPSTDSTFILTSSRIKSVAGHPGAVRVMVTGGSIAVKQPEVFSHWIERYGAERIILGADVHNEKIAVSGWLETTDNDLMPFIEGYCKQGIQKVLCTDIAKDGMFNIIRIAFGTIR